MGDFTQGGERPIKFFLFFSFTAYLGLFDEKGNGVETQAKFELNNKG